MADEWIQTRLREIAADSERAFAMGPFGSNIRAENYRDAGVPVIRGTNLTEPGGAPFIHSDFAFLTEDKADELASSTAKPNDIVFVAQGTVGKVGIIPTATPYKRFILSQNLMKVTLNPEKADPRFVFYFYRSGLGQHEILSRTNPTGVPCISKPLTSLRDFGIRLPLDVNEQRAIAHVLRTLDDKIELNRRMNETLEAIAQALFKSWFIDAAADGLPEGWRESTIGEEVRVVGGSTPSTASPEFWEGGSHHWATPKDLSAVTSPVLLDTERKITAAGVKQISSGLLPKGSVLLSSRAPIGYLAISQMPVSVNQGFIAMVCDKELPNHYVRLWAKQNMETIKANANGTTFLEISKKNFRPLPVVVPPKDVIEKFVRHVKPLNERVVSNLKESQTLATLRDALLPKLLSGEIQPKEVKGSMMG